MAVGSKGRTPTEQSRHDEAVRRSAAQYKARGYRVTADVEGFSRPDPIRGRRPDVVAQKGRDKVVVEWETPSTLSADKAQQEALRRGAEAMGAHFEVRLAKGSKRRRA